MYLVPKSRLDAQDFKHFSSTHNNYKINVSLFFSRLYKSKTKANNTVHTIS